MDKLQATLSPAQGMSANLSNNINLHMQVKEVEPTDEPQAVVPDAGYVGLSRVVVGAIPNNYGQIIFNGSYLLVK